METYVKLVEEWNRVNRSYLWWCELDESLPKDKDYVSLIRDTRKDCEKMIPELANKLSSIEEQIHEVEKTLFIN